VLNQKWLPACAGMTDFFVMYGAKSQAQLPGVDRQFDCLRLEETFAA
jgi:hypothetical protein